jgi:hypothetical protein
MPSIRIVLPHAQQVPEMRRFYGMTGRFDCGADYILALSCDFRRPFAISGYRFAAA